jgi:hypothetical protein
VAAMVSTDRDTRFPSMAVCRDQLNRAIAAIRRAIPYTEGMYRPVESPDRPTGAPAYAEPSRPPSAPASVDALKRYLTDDAGHVRVHDLVVGQADAVRAAAIDDKARLERTPPSPEAVRAHLRDLDNRAETLVALFAAGCYWGRPGHEAIWVKALGRACDVRDVLLAARGPSSPADVWIWDNLRYYPAMLALYAGGMAAMEARNWGLVASLLTRPITRIVEQPAILELNARALMPASAQRAALGNANVLTPLSEHVYRTLRAPLRDLFAEAAAYEPAFDRFEYFIALVVADLSANTYPGNGRPTVPLGRFRRLWAAGREIVSAGDRVAQGLETEARAAGARWPPLEVGLFGGSRDRLERALGAVRDRMRSPSED